MSMKDNIGEHGYIYGKWQFAPDTWVINFGGSLYCYLLVGEEKAMLIDTAYGVGDLRAMVESITDKPVMVCNTHGHFDHTGGNALWPDAWMSEQAAVDAKKAFGEEMQRKFEAMPHPDYTIHTLQDGDVIDLGGRTVEIVAIGCHHPGSLAYIDSKSRCVFTGDELESGQVLYLRTDLTAKEQAALHKQNMEKLLAKESQYDLVCPAHNGSPIVKQYIRDFITLDSQIMAGTQTVQPDLAGNGFAPTQEMLGRKAQRAQFGGASACYPVD